MTSNPSNPVETDIEMHAWICEGLTIGFSTPDFPTPLPMVHSKAEFLRMFRPYVEAHAQKVGKPAYLVKFTKAVIVDTVESETWKVKP